MTPTTHNHSLISDIQNNCDISDAKDHGIYSMCTMVLKLRNLYKWENDIAPWEEPEPTDLLDWIEAKENFWSTLAGMPYGPVTTNGNSIPPYDIHVINSILTKDNLVYGAGYGRSMKAVFFLAHLEEQKIVEGCKVLILNREVAREMASPFAMAQEGVIYIRKQPLRYFLWDQIQELRASCRFSLRHALKSYNLIEEGKLNQELLKDTLDDIVERELDLFIYHEVGEVLQQTFNSSHIQKIIATFPGSAIEFVCRSLKDILADTHPRGPLAHIIREQRQSTLSFYIGFLDGMRKLLFPEITSTFEGFLNNNNNNWQAIEEVRRLAHEQNLERAHTIISIVNDMNEYPPEQIQDQFNKKLLQPLGLDIPQ